MAWVVVFGREGFVSKSELSLSLFWMLLARQVGAVSCARLGELRGHHSQGQGLLRAVPALGAAGLPCPPLLPFQEHKMQDLGTTGW